MCDAAGWRAFDAAVAAVPGVSKDYPLPTPPPKHPRLLPATRNYAGLLFAAVLTLLLVFQPFVALAALACAGWAYGAEACVALALTALSTRAVLRRVWGPEQVGVARAAGFGPGTYYHGMDGDGGGLAALVRAWVSVRPDYEGAYEAWWVRVYRAFDFGCVLTGYESTGDCMTLFGFLFYQRLRLAETYQRRMWVTVPRHTEDEHVLGVPYEAPEGGDEALGCDWAFPTMPCGDVAWGAETRLLIVLHGLNGGSSATYVRDTAEKAVLDHRHVVCAINARGMGDTPVAGDALWHGARCGDLQVAFAKVLAVWDAFCEARAGGRPRSNAAYGVGFSAGALALLQVLDRCGRPPQGHGSWGEDFGTSADGARRLKLHGAVAVSGLYDRHFEVDYVEEQGGRAVRSTAPRIHAGRTWHPIISAGCVNNYSVYKDRVAKRNEAIKHRAASAECPNAASKYAPIHRDTQGSDASAATGPLSTNGYLPRREYVPICLASFARARDVRELDIEFTAPYNGFGSGMQGFRNYTHSQAVSPEYMQMCPVLLLAAMDDPVIPPIALVQGVEKVTPRHRPHKCVTYVTRSGGHLGWMQGNPFTRRNWAFMTDTTFSFLHTCGEA